MSSQGFSDHNRAQGCSLLWTADGQPLAHASKLLRMSGVRVSKIDKRTNEIEGRVGRWGDRYGCKVTVRLFPNTCDGLSLVEMVCEGPLLRHRSDMLAAYIETLRENFEKTMPKESQPDAEGRESRQASTGERVRVTVTELMKKMQIELAKRGEAPPGH